MKEFLSAQITPVVPLRGSISASGGKHISAIPLYMKPNLVFLFLDLSPLSYIAGALGRLHELFLYVHLQITSCSSRQSVHPTSSRRQSPGHPPDLSIPRSLASTWYRTYCSGSQRTFRIGKRNCRFCGCWRACHTRSSPSLSSSSDLHSYGHRSASWYAWLICFFYPCCSTSSPWSGK